MAVNGINLAINQRWLTRGGEEVEIVNYDAETDTPYVWDLSNGGSVTNEGSDVYEGSHSPDDLITLIQDEHGFIPWNGGKCPVSDRTVVEYRMRNGQVDTTIAGKLEWEYENDSADIIAYRVVEQQDKPKQKKSAVENTVEATEEPKYTVEQVFKAISEATDDLVTYTNVSKVKAHLAKTQDPDYKLYLELKAKFE